MNQGIHPGRGPAVPGNRWDLLDGPFPPLPEPGCPATPGHVPAPEVSVIVPYWCDQPGLDRLVRALLRQNHPRSRMELVVVDDGSPVPPVLPSDLPFASRVLGQEDRGFRASAARALGAAHADGQVFAFLDGDMMPEPGYVAAAAAHPAVSGESVVVGRRRHVVPALLGTSWQPGDAVPDDALLPDPGWLADAYRATDDLRHGDSTAYRFVISAVLTLSREIYEDAGGFDPGFVGYGGEDWDLAHRLWRTGGLLEHESRAVAWHADTDFAGREDPVTARRIKNRETMVLAPRVSAPTARGLSLITGTTIRWRTTPTGPTASAPAGDTTTVPEDARGPRITASVPLEPGHEAATILCVDALLQAWPTACVTILPSPPGDVPAHVLACLTDPRIEVLDAPRPRQDVPVPDWSVEVHHPCRPQGAGVRPNAWAASSWLARLEAAGVERVTVVAGEQSLATLTGSRAVWRARRWGAEDPTRQYRVSAVRVGWHAMDSEPDLEAWWGGWG